MHLATRQQCPHLTMRTLWQTVVEGIGGGHSKINKGGRRQQKIVGGGVGKRTMGTGAVKRSGWDAR